MTAPRQQRLSIVLPTYNEKLNVSPIVEQLLPLGEDYDLEILFVDDDSTDGTADAVVALAHRYPFVRLIRRVGRFGLSSAIKEGVLNATGDVVVVMDSDGQHQPVAVATAVQNLLSTNADLLIGSRFHEHADMFEYNCRASRDAQTSQQKCNFLGPWTG